MTLRYRVTLLLGQDTTERDELERRAEVLLGALTTSEDGARPAVGADFVKATVEVVAAVLAEDGLAATMNAVTAVEAALAAAGLDRPRSIVNVETEPIPQAEREDPLPLHPVHLPD